MEVLLLLVVLLAVVALVANQMMSSAHKLTSKIDERTDAIINSTQGSTCLETDADCHDDRECCSGVCIYGKCA